MDKIKTMQLVRRHWPALLAAFIFGFIMLMPTLASIQNIGWHNFQGVYPVLSDDETHYLAMAQDMKEGRSRLGNAFYFEHKDDPEIMSSWPSRFLALESSLLGLPIPSTFFINDFLMAFIGLLSLYCLFFFLCRNRAIALAGSSAYYLIFLSTFNRPVMPQTGIIILFWGLNLIWRIYSAESAKKRVFLNLLLGLCVGVLVYVYPYYWTSLLVVFGLTAIWLAYKRADGILLSVAAFLLSFLPFALAYLANMSFIARTLYYSETAVRMGLLSTHWPASYFNAGLLVLSLIAVIAMWKNIDRQKGFFAAILIFAGLALNWSNIITGKYLQFSSHYYMISVLFILIVMLMAVPGIPAMLRESFRNKNWKNINLSLVCGCLIFIIIAAAILYKQKSNMIDGIRSMAGVTANEMARLQSFKPIFDWLNANTPNDSVLMVFVPELIDFIPVYTHNNLYSYGYAGAYLASDLEMERRWIGQKMAEGMFAPDMESILADHRSLWLNGLIDNYQNQAVRNRILSFAGIKSASPEFYDFRAQRVFDSWLGLKNLPVREVLGAYRLDYIIDDCSHSSGYGVKLFENSGFCVFKW